VTNKEMLEIAMQQSAMDIGCKREDFLSCNNVIVPLNIGENAKAYYEKPIGANFISYGNNLVVGTNEKLSSVINEYINKFDYYHCFENPNMYWLNEKIKPLGYTVCFMAEYYLPDLDKLKEFSCDYELRVLKQADFTNLYLTEWSNALCSKRKHLDVLGVGAYDKDKLVGFAACSKDADMMWQIGVDVLPDYRRKGIAKALTTKLTKKILEHDKVPFYSTAWSNIRSVRNAIKCGYVPTWVEMSIKPIDKVNEING